MSKHIANKATRYADSQINAQAIMFAPLRRSAYAVTGSKLPTAVAQRPLRKALLPYAMHL
ncbi:MAG: hypothetical protein GX262_06060 [Clostridia bacterium]|nr:hypothetical protein [Clostridia bacterium]